MENTISVERAKFLLKNKSYGSLKFAFLRISLSDMLYDDGITEKEDLYIKGIWELMPDNTCYNDALARIAYPGNNRTIPERSWEEEEEQRRDQEELDYLMGEY